MTDPCSFVLYDRIEYCFMSGTWQVTSNEGYTHVVSEHELFTNEKYRASFCFLMTKPLSGRELSELEWTSPSTSSKASTDAFMVDSPLSACTTSSADPTFVPDPAFMPDYALPTPSAKSPENDFDWAFSFTTSKEPKATDSQHDYEDEEDWVRAMLATPCPKRFRPARKSTKKSVTAPSRETTVSPSLASRDGSVSRSAIRKVDSRMSRGSATFVHLTPQKMRKLQLVK